MATFYTEALKYTEQKHCSSSTMSTLVLQDLHLIWAALMSSQRATQLLCTIY